jgi:branched-chain amino acid aminotransferase
MWVTLNGRLVPAARARISVFDRSFLYGDGLFETIYVRRERPFRLALHLDRLEAGARFLNLRLPFARGQILRQIAALLARNAPAGDSLLRLTVSRGVGPRGYSPKGADRPVLVLAQQPAARVASRSSRGWRVVISSMRLPAGEALARYKTNNKLPQILARAEAEARGAQEALLLNTDGHVVEAASSNLFWLRAGTVYTSPLEGGILAGVTRAVVLELCQALGIPVRKGFVRPAALRRQDAVFLSLSSLGVVPVSELDGRPLAQSPVVGDLRREYWKLVATEAG